MQGLQGMLPNLSALLQLLQDWMPPRQFLTDALIAVTLQHSFLCYFSEVAWSKLVS